MNERRPSFGRPIGEYGRAFEYSEPRYCPNGGPRSYHDEDPRGYHPENLHPAGDRRAVPPRREDSYHCYRGGRDDAHSGHQGDFRDYRDGSRRKGSFPPQRDRSPFKRDVPHSPHSRSGSSLSSRSYSPEKGKAYYYQQRKNKDRPSSHSVSASRDGSPHSSTSTSKGNVDKSSKPPETQPAEVLSEKAEVPLEKSPDSCEAHADNEVVPVPEGDSEEPTPAQDEVVKMKSDFQERRSQAIAAKAREIEKVYRQDCETFGMVVKMLVAKEPSLEKQLQSPLKENLSEIRERCLEDLRHFISELDEVVLQPEASH